MAYTHIAFIIWPATLVLVHAQNNKTLIRLQLTNWPGSQFYLVSIDKVQQCRLSMQMQQLANCRSRLEENKFNSLLSEWPCPEHVLPQDSRELPLPAYIYRQNNSSPSCKNHHVSVCSTVLGAGKSWNSIAHPARSSTKASTDLFVFWSQSLLTEKDQQMLESSDIPHCTTFIIFQPFCSGQLLF